MKDFDLKFLSSDQIDLIVPLYHLIDKNLEADVVISRLRSMIQSDYKILAVSPKGTKKIIAMAGVSFGTKLFCGDYMQIHHMVTLEEHRKSGAASAILTYLRCYGRMRDVNITILDSYNEAKIAHKFFLQNDFCDLGKHFIKKMVY